MAKEIKAVVKVQIQAGKATPAPPIGPALAPHGLNIAEFCQKFNAATQAMAGYKIPAEVTIYKDRSFVFKLKTPLAAELICKAIGIEKGSGTPNKVKVGKITKHELWGSKTLAYEIQKETKGTYSYYEYEADSQKVQPFEKWLKIQPQVLRSLTIKK